MKFDMVIIVSVIVILLLSMVVYIVIHKEKYASNTQTTNPVGIANGLNSTIPDTLSYNKFYETLGPYKGCSDSPTKVLPNMLQLPPAVFGRGFYSGVFNQVFDPVSGIPVQMYTSERVPLSDFQSETERCGCCETCTPKCANCPQ